MKKSFMVLSFSILLVGVLSFISLAKASPVVFLDESWDSAQVHNRIAAYIVKHGYERKVEFLFSETLPGMLGLERGDVHICLDVWVNNTPEWWAKAQKKDSVVNLGVNYPNAPQGWYVPTYVIKGDPERGIEPVAPDLQYVDDLEAYAGIFKDPEDPSKGRFYNAPPGWKISSINECKMKTLGLDKIYVIFSPGSDTALQTVARASYKKGEPVIFYYWQPTALMGLFDMTRLKEKTPYDAAKWNEKAGYGCDFPAQSVLKLANANFAEANPELIDFFRRYETTLGMNDQILARRSVDNLSLEETAIWFLKTYPDIWRSWIPEDRQDVLKKVNQVLGL